MTILYIGRRVPKRFNELTGSTHLGNGVWIFNVELKKSEGLDYPTKKRGKTND